MSLSLIKSFTAAIGLALLTRICLRSELLVPRNQIPSHLINQPIHVQRDLLTPQIGEELLRLVETIGASDGYPTNVVDTSFYHTQHHHIGEAVPAIVEKDGSVICENPFLVPSKDRKSCHLAGRIDIGKHLILTGGARGLREPYSKIISRVQSFGAYMFNLNKYPVVSRLFQDQKFLNTALKVCPKNKQILDPFQFNFIIQVPGQTVATHIDGVYFKGASRFQFPQWLLAAMKFSGMWEKQFVNQVQVVGYLHRWEPNQKNQNQNQEKDQEQEETLETLETDPYGSFVYWNSKNSTPKRVLPFPLSGNVVDGSKVVHAASVYRKDADIPTIVSSIPHWLKKVVEDEEGGEGEGGEGGEGAAAAAAANLDGRWTVSNEKDGVLKNYTLNDLRISIVYRARCFENEKEAKDFNEKLHGDGGVDGRYTLDEILITFLNDLIEKGYYEKGSMLEDIDRLDLAMKIMKVYIKYPLPSSPTIPWNYCALGRLAPWLEKPLSWIC